MSSKAHLLVGNLSRTYYFVPNYLAFLFNQSNYHWSIDSEDGNEFEVGLKATATEIAAALTNANFTRAACAQMYEFFRGELISALNDWLIDDTSGWIDHKHDNVESYLGSNATGDANRELEDFVQTLIKINNLDFSSDPLCYPTPQFPRKKTPLQLPDQTAHDYFTWKGRYTDIDFDLLSGYVFTHYKKFPVGSLLLTVMFDPALSRIAQDYAEFIDLFWLRLAVDAVPEDTVVYLDVADFYDNDVEDSAQLIGFLDELQYDLLRDLTEKVNFYNTIYTSLVMSKEPSREELVRLKCRDSLRKCDRSDDSFHKGTILEELVASLYTSSSSLEVTDKRLNTGDEEIDIVLKNNIDRPFWLAQHSPLMFVECKNWKSLSARRNYVILKENSGIMRKW